jgi:small subunit ribosomal protein S8
MKEAICKVLVEAKYLKDINVNDLDNNKKDLVAVLLYKGKRPAITKINRISKSGIRKFSSSEKLPYVLSGLGDAIISTSQGVMTASAARKRRLGGEIICKVW